MEPLAYPLDRPLPAGMLLPRRQPRYLYRHYPVFSWPWLRGRTLVFLAALALYATFTAVTIIHSTGNPATGIQVGLVQFIGFGLMVMSGPGLASWIRHRRWPARREAIGVVLVVLAGIVVSAVVDLVGSEQVGRLLGEPADPPRLRSYTLLAANLVLLLLIYGTFGGGLALRAYFAERRHWADHQQREALALARERAQQAELRLGVLQAQVEPHFLFNTLASVRAGLRSDPQHAEATLDALVDFLRSTIPRLRADDARIDATLGGQLAICSHYLAVMQLRTGGRLRHEVDVPAALHGHPFPPSILITLVENAVKHGIEPRTGPGRVLLSAEARDGRLRVSVSDDGIGLQPGSGTGMGLANVREHLQHRYAGRARLQLESRAGGGVTATLDLPLEGTAQ